MRQEDIDAANAAETLEDAFKALIGMVYSDATPQQQSEIKKIFFCGAAFLMDRIMRWTKEEDPDIQEKIDAVIQELVDFVRRAKEENDIVSSIKEAWGYAWPDED